MMLVINTYEGDDELPILTHIFHGETRDDALAVMRAHMETDEFFRASVNDGEWNGIELSNEEEWQE